MPENTVLPPGASAPSLHPLASQFDSLFRGRRNAYGTYDLSNPIIDSDGKEKGEALTLKFPSPDDNSWLALWSNHLFGVQPGLGVFPVDEAGKCSWGCIDVDSKTANELGVSPDSLAQRVSELNLPLMVCHSKSKNAAHLYFFTSTSAPAVDMRGALEAYREQLGLPASVEVFPKVSADTDCNFPGGWVNMPYHGDTRCAI